MTDDDSVRYAVAMQAYIRHLAESLKFWRGRTTDTAQARIEQDRLDEFMDTYRRYEVSDVYERLRREVQEILLNEQ